jgi:hypothetical protein
MDELARSTHLALTEHVVPQRGQHRFTDLGSDLAGLLPRRWSGVVAHPSRGGRTYLVQTIYCLRRVGVPTDGQLSNLFRLLLVLSHVEVLTHVVPSAPR